MTTGETYANQLQNAYDDLWRTLGRFDATQREEAPLRDGWTPKTLLAHIAFWDDFQTRRMMAAISGESAAAGVTWPTLDNDQRMALDRTRDWDAIAAEAEAARRRMIDFARSLSDDALNVDYPEGERTLSLARLLAHMVRHAHLHEADLLVGEQ